MPEPTQIDATQPPPPDMPAEWAEAIAQSDAEAGISAPASEPPDTPPAAEPEPAKQEPAKEPPAKQEPSATRSRAFELLERSRAEAAKRAAEIAAKKQPPAPVQAPARKPANAIEALETSGFSIDDIIRDSLRQAGVEQQEKPTGKPMDQEALMGLIQERTAQIVEKRMSELMAEAQRQSMQAEEERRAVALHEQVHEHIAAVANDLTHVAAAAKRNPVAVTEALVAVYDSVLQATGKKLRIDQAAKRLNAILADDEVQAKKPEPQESKAKPAPPSGAVLSDKDLDKQAHEEALAILTGKIPTPDKERMRR